LRFYALLKGALTEKSLRKAGLAHQQELFTAQLMSLFTARKLD